MVLSRLQAFMALVVPEASSDMLLGADRVGRSVSNAFGDWF